MDPTGIKQYECRICLETAKEAVVTRCGHLYCWPCLQRWFSMQPHAKSCPVCTAPIDENMLITIIDGKNTGNPGNSVQPDVD